MKLYDLIIVIPVLAVLFFTSCDRSDLYSLASMSLSEIDVEEGAGTTGTGTGTEADEGSLDLNIEIDRDTTVVSWKTSISSYDHAVIDWQDGCDTIAYGVDSYRIENLADGLYVVTLTLYDSDGSGCISAWADICIAVSPDKVTLGDISISSDSITVNWSDPADSDLDYISVEWTKGAVSGISSISSGTESFTIGSLSDGDECQLVLYAVDRASNYSQSADLTLVFDSSIGSIMAVSDATVFQNINYGLSGNYYLAGDLDFYDVDWSSIGSSLYPFTGTFNGNGHTIKNFNHLNSDTVVGVFEFIGSGGAVTNLNVEGSVLNDTAGGALVAAFNYGEISYCSCSGTLTGDGSIKGGIAGSNVGTISYCFSSATIVDTLSSSYTGGIAGINTGTLYCCYATGDITGYDKVGGLVGSNGSAAAISNCYATGSVTVADSGSVGGLAGLNKGSVEQCYAVGTVVELGSSWYSGGLIGQNTGTVTDSLYDQYSTGMSDSGKGTGAAHTDMLDKSTFTALGWDFSNLWNIDVALNNGYPYLVTVGPLQ